jgi:hypothetical protein
MLSLTPLREIVITLGTITLQTLLILLIVVVIVGSALFTWHYFSPAKHSKKIDAAYLRKFIVEH